MEFLFPGSNDQSPGLQFEVNLGSVMKMGFGGKGARWDCQFSCPDG
jgi:hypothetical protein